MTCTYWHAHARLQKLNLQNVTVSIREKSPRYTVCDQGSH